MKKITILLFICSALTMHTIAQPVLKTGGQQMPNEWIDADTHHKIIKLTRKEGSNMSFYFHNNPFVNNKMVFYNSEKQNSDAIKKQENYNSNGKNKQLYIVDLKTLALEQLTSQASPMKGEIVSATTNEVFYQIVDTVFATNITTKKRAESICVPCRF